LPTRFARLIMGDGGQIAHTTSRACRADFSNKLQFETDLFLGLAANSVIITV